MRRRRQEPLHPPPLSYLLHRTTRSHFGESVAAETIKLNNLLIDFITTDSDNDNENYDDDDDDDGVMQIMMITITMTAVMLFLMMMIIF